MNNKTLLNITFISLLIILLIAAFFRFYRLAEIPPGLYPDVAINGNDAINALRSGDFRVFYPENNGREGLFINLIALSFAVFGVSVWAIKFVPAVIGVLTVLGIYLMVKELFSNQPWQIINWENDKEVLPSVKSDQEFAMTDSLALLTAFFLTTSFWHILFSRLGFRAIMVPFFLVWSFYFLFKGINVTRINLKEQIINPTNEKEKSLYSILYILYFIIAGILFGLGFHTYIAFRMTPLILTVVILIEIYNYWPRFKSLTTDQLPLTSVFKQIYIKDGWWRWDAFFVAIIIVVLPLAIYFYQHPQDFLGRAGQISIFSSSNPFKDSLIASIKTFGMFNIWGDCNWRHNYACAPQLSLPVGILFLIGLFITLRNALSPLFKIFSKKNDGESQITINKAGWSAAQVSYFLLSWFFIMLLPAILTNEGLPHALRTIGVIPIVYIFVALGSWWLIEALKIKNKKMKFFLIIIFLFWLPLYTFNYYFLQWGQHPEVKGAHTQYFVDIGNYLNSLPPTAKKYVIVNENGVLVPYPDGIPMPAQTIMFITHQTPNIIYLKPEQISSYDFQSSGIVVLMKYDIEIIKTLKEKLSHGKIKQENNIWTFQF